MSRPRAGSPPHPSHRWEERHLGRSRESLDQDPPMARGQRPRRGPEGYRRFQRRSPSRPDDREYGRQRYPPQEEFYRGRPSPRRDYKDGGSEGNRGAPREDVPAFHSRSRSPHSPLRVQRERLPSEAHRRTDFSDGPSAPCWRAGDPGRARGEFCPQEGRKDLRFSPGERFSGDRGRGDPHHKRSPPLEGQRSEWEDLSHSGFGKQSLGSDSFGPDPRGRPSQGDLRHSGPLIIDHGHGVCEDRGPRQWGRAGRYGDHEPRSKRHRSSSRDGFGPNKRAGDPEEFRGSPYGTDPDPARWDTERSSQDRSYRKEHPSCDGAAHHRGHHWPPPGKGTSSQRRTDWQHKNPPHAQQRHQPRQQRPGFHAQRDESRGPEEGEPGWAGELRRDPRRPRPESLERDLTREDLDPKMPRLWLQNLQNVNDPPTEDEETLTIKVDMSRPVTLESSGRFPADRQLSQDLVNVGRQRLDFLPMLQHSGTFRETSVHMGTFAEEIISLVHHVKEVYFKGDAVTLNQRFSAPPPVSVQEDEKEELTLNQRFSTNRGLRQDLDSLLEEDEPLLPPLELLQKPQRGPGDLRHNLERRRQERLEGVKVTITGGGSAPQPLLSSLSGWISTFRNQDSVTEVDAPQWAPDSGPRPKSHVGHRRGFFRPNGPGRNYRRGFGPKRQSNPAGPGW